MSSVLLCLEPALTYCLVVTAALLAFLLSPTGALLLCLTAMVCLAYLSATHLSICETLVCLLPLPTGAVRQYDAVDSNPTLLKMLDNQNQIGTTLQLKVGAQVSLSVGFTHGTL